MIISSLLKRYLLFLLFIRLTISFDYNGRCEIIEDNSPCIGIVPKNTLIYVPFNQTQNQIFEFIHQDFTFYSLVSLYNESCSSSSLSLLCSNYFRPCVVINDTNPKISLPQSPCYNVCVETHNKCIDYTELNCSTIGQYGQYIFPMYNITYNLSQYGGSEFEPVLCNDNYLELPIKCPYPLVTVDENMSKEDYFYILAGKCALPCPFSFWSSHKMDILYIVQMTINILSFISGILLILFYGIFPTQITQRMELILSFGVTSTLVSISYFMENKDRNLYCGKDHRFMTIKDPWCAVNAITFQYGIMALTFLWAVLSYDFFKTIRMEQNKYFGYQRIAVWSLALIFTILPITKYEASPTTIGCYINDSTNSFWQYLCFYVPLWICLCFVLSSTIYSIYKIYTLYNVLKDKTVLYYNIKQIVIMLIVLFNFIFVTVYKFYSISRMPLYKSRLEQWVICLYRDGNDKCELDIPDFGLRLVLAIVTSNNGFIGLLAYGLDMNNIKIFKKSKIGLFIMSKAGLSWSDTSISYTNTTTSSGNPNQFVNPRKATMTKLKTTPPLNGAVANNNNNNTTTSNTNDSGNKIEETNNNNNNMDREMEVQNINISDNSLNQNNNINIDDGDVELDSFSNSTTTCNIGEGNQ